MCRELFAVLTNKMPVCLGQCKENAVGGVGVRVTGDLDCVLTLDATILYRW